MIIHLVIIAWLCSLHTVLTGGDTAKRANIVDNENGRIVLDTAAALSHPMLFFDYGDIAGLRRKAETTHKHIAEKIKSMANHVIKHPSWYLPPPYEQFISSWNEKYGNNLCALSFYCLLYPTDTEMLEFVHNYIDILVEYPTWMVKGMERDEMPISHTLVGVATAFDFLYPTFTSKQRAKVYNRIRLTTNRMYERFKHVSWGSFHLQNHVLNNCVALLIGALTVLPHYPQNARLWSNMVISHLNRTTYLLDMIVDGSLDEGVTYSTYTTRSLTMFAYLAHRHFGLNYYQNQWWERHFWYLYYTLLPGYKEPLAIADANAIWMYGPESQLVFLDTYVLKNGNGNWLASIISEHREAKGFLFHSSAQKFAAYHTEFIWYNNSISERAPDNTSDLYLFSDWGVVTYGGGKPAGNTFLSFKSAKMHGMAINNAVRYSQVPQYIEGWSSFNAGHEHPDQNSFTFWPRGYPFITESYYSAKFSFLNSVLMFGPSNLPSESLCFPPYEGQIGECYKWFNYLSNNSAIMSSEVIASFEKDGYVFISGEAALAYRRELKLKSVYRSLLLLTPDVLLIVDHIEMHTNHFLKNISAFFQLKFGNLEVDDIESEARLLYNDQDMYIAWKSISGGHGVASKHIVNLAQQSFPRAQYLNVTFPVDASTTRMAYVLHNSNPLVGELKIHDNVEDGVKLSVFVDEKLYFISIATSHSEPTKRKKQLGHLGYATLNVDDKFVQFGIDTHNGSSWITHKYKEQNFSDPDLIGMLLIMNVMLLLGLIALQYFTVSLIRVTGKIKWLNKVLIYLKVFLFLCNLFYLCLFARNYFILPDGQHKEPRALPIVFISSLPFGGAQIYGAILNKSSDITDNTSETNYDTLQYIHPCAGRDWSKFIKQLYYDNELSYVPMIISSDSVWNYNMVKETSVKLIYVVTDPKSWIAEVISQHKQYNLVADLIDAFSNVQCDVKWRNLAELQEHLLNLQVTNLTFMVDLLAELWVAEVWQALHELASLNIDYIMVMTEDLLSRPTETTELLFAHIGLPLTIEARNYALQLSRSRNVMSSFNLLLSLKEKVWRKFLTAEQVGIIESRTNFIMKQLKFNN